MSPIEDWLVDRVGRQKADPLLRELAAALQVVFGEVAERRRVGAGLPRLLPDGAPADVVEFASVDPAALPWSTLE